MTIKQLKKLLEAYDDDTPCAYDIWLPEDVKSHAGDVTSEQIAETLSNMQRRKDASIGLNWDVLNACLPAGIE